MGQCIADGLPATPIALGINNTILRKSLVSREQPMLSISATNAIYRSYKEMHKPSSWQKQVTMPTFLG
ncbi:hypothetical protein yberc0001_3150 [Yersinia bercovieri ATCC 43970]|uniref:Uncharacterized protein n=1 Tax=Yersinia bercovieri ATCC 43970 TaxID=349968 RepID=A0ABP2E880_YERBE|nr:hypothetical protein yberc0001_3150 [Yersinia bercovieri ATCC 43970]